MPSDGSNDLSRNRIDGCRFAAAGPIEKIGRHEHNRLDAAVCGLQQIHRHIVTLRQLPDHEEPQVPVPVQRHRLEVGRVTQQVVQPFALLESDTETLILDLDDES
ncbi:hypothetical protein, partial [Nocardia sp. NPDC059154]|uniref:hypothetical protein n=1 Tax=Nocardia sp. NPDC059154 TaxID=3346744 RepID=UPI0036B4D61D